MRILCTGGRGYLGSRLYTELVFRGHNATAVDRSDGDLASGGVALSLVQQHDAEMVVHLAARPGRVLCEHDLQRASDDNVVATVEVARACAQHGARFCYVSTSEVYGDYQSTAPLTESDAGLGRFLNFYAMTKWFGEKASELYAPDDLLIIRPSMAYGPGMPTGYGRAALPTMIDNFLHGEPYTVHANTARSWCYVDDLVRGMADVIERGEGVYNVGRDDEMDEMIDLAYIVCDVLGADIGLIQMGEVDATIRPVKDISMDRLRSLGWEPQIDIIEGIKRTASALGGDA